MSYGQSQSVDPTLIEQTKQQIRSLVAEIAQLAKAEISPEQFYSEFLPRVVTALAAVGGAVWTTNEEGRLALQYQVNLPETRLAEKSEQEQRRHTRLLYKVLADGQATLVPPQSGFGDESEAGNPTEYLLVIGLLKTDLETVGLVEIFQRSEAGLATQKGYLRFLVQMCELACEFLKSHQLRHLSHRQTLWSRLEDFLRAVYRSLDPRDTAFTIANEGRRLIECDRLTVAVRKGSRYRVEAISGQDIFDSRSNSVRLLENLATVVAAAGDDVWYTGDTQDMAPQVEAALQDYVDEAHSKTVAVLPLKRPRPSDQEEPDKSSPTEPPVGVLVVEQIEDRRVPPSMLQRVEVVCRHSAAALGNALEHHSLFLMPVWKLLGKSRVVVQARNLPWTVSISALLLVAVLFLSLFPKEFRVESQGTLEPVVARDVFATVKGVVEQTKVKHGDMVARGDVLVQLRDPELEMALIEKEGLRAETLKRIEWLEHVLVDSGDRSSEDRDRIAGELAENRARLTSLEAEIGVLSNKKSELLVRSPIDGQVITWDVEKRLINRPVQRGQVLMRIADLEKDWQLELHMPENRIGHVVRAAAEASQRAAELGQPQRGLDVQYQLATHPGLRFHGEVIEIHRSAEVRSDEGNTVLIKVKIDKNRLLEATGMNQLQAGATVTGKVYCGRRAIGYVWFHDLVAWFQTKVIFRYF